MKAIILKNIHQEACADGFIIEYTLDINNSIKKLWYRFSGVDCKIGLVSELFDPIAVLFLHYALRYGYNLESKYPISQELYYTLSYHVIPHLYACNKSKAHNIKISAPTTEKKIQGSWNGAGVSCGIDSMATIYEYYNEMNMEEYKLTHLVYFKVGQHAEELPEYNPNEEQRHFEDGKRNAIDFGKTIGLPVIVGESNYNDIVTELFGHESKVPTFTFRNAGSVLILQDFFARYYYASSYGDLNHFVADLGDDVAYYERWLLPLISTNNTRFYSASKAMERVEKTALVAKYPSSYNHLSVCWRGAKNCGYCNKCIRTMMTLDLLGKLDAYSEVFDLDLYKKRKKDYFAYAYLVKYKNSFYAEIFDYMKKKQLPMPKSADVINVCRKKVKNRRFPFLKDNDLFE